MRSCLVKITTSSRALIGFGTLRKRVTDLKKVEDQNQKFILKVIGKPHKMEAQAASEHFFKVVLSLQSKRGGLLRSS